MGRIRGELEGVRWRFASWIITGGVREVEGEEENGEGIGNCWVLL